MSLLLIPRERLRERQALEHAGDEERGAETDFRGVLWAIREAGGEGVLWVLGDVGVDIG